MKALIHTVDIEVALKQVAEHKAWLVEQAAIVYRSAAHPAHVQANNALRWSLLFSLMNTPPHRSEAGSRCTSQEMQEVE